MRKKTIGLVGAAFVALGVAGSPLLAIRSVHASGVDQSLVTLDPPGSIDTRPFGISSTGDIVGLYFTADQRGHGFLLTRGVYTSIDVPGAIRTNAVGITVLSPRRPRRDDGENETSVCDGRAAERDAGQHEHGPCEDLAIVGRYDTPDGHAHGYVLSGGALTTFDFPGVTFTVASGINSSGQIVGRYRSPDGIFHGYLLSDGNFTTIDYPGAVSLEGITINAEGDIAGYYVDAGRVFHGFLLSEGSFTTFDPPGSVQTGGPASPLGLNSRGEIVGCYTTADGRTHGFVLRNGKYTSFDIAGVRLTCNNGVNQHGDIVGLFEDVTGRRHGFLAPKGTEH